MVRPFHPSFQIFFFVCTARGSEKINFSVSCAVGNLITEFWFSIFSHDWSMKWILCKALCKCWLGGKRVYRLSFFGQKRLRAFLEYFAERFWNGINFLSRMLFAERLNWSHAMVKMSPRRQFSCIYFVEWFVGLICFLLEP